jgi:hypothetical protein
MSCPNLESFNKKARYLIPHKAELDLAAIENKPNFSPLMLQILSSEIDYSTKFAAAVYFKNFIKRRWPQVGTSIN